MCWSGGRGKDNNDEDLDESVRTWMFFILISVAKSLCLLQTTRFLAPYRICH